MYSVVVDPDPPAVGGLTAEAHGRPLLPDRLPNRAAVIREAVGVWLARKGDRCPRHQYRRAEEPPGESAQEIVPRMELTRQ